MRTSSDLTESTSNPVVAGSSQDRQWRNLCQMGFHGQEVCEVLAFGPVAEATSHAAQKREESRGAHARRDFAQRDDARYLAHSLACRTDGPPRLEYVPVRLTRWQPQERTY